MIYAIAITTFFACAADSTGSKPVPSASTTTPMATVIPKDSSAVDPAELVAFAQKLVGIRYKYASADPDNGFDCSGFVSYVFKHFDILVPRSSSAFSAIGKKVSLEEAKAGDIILFTSPKSKERRVGHVAIVTGAGDQVSFIHASSGKSYSVTESTMTSHYKQRFIKVVRVLP